MNQSPPRFDLNEKQIKWIVFLILLIFFPAIFFLLFAVPIWPVLYVLLDIFPSSILRGQFIWALVFFAECVFWICIFYFLSNSLAKTLNRLKRGLKLVIVSAFVLFLYGAAFFPLYDFNYQGLKSKVSAFYVYFSSES